QIVLHQQNLSNILRCDLIRKSRNALAKYHSADGAQSLSGNVLRCRQRFKAGVVPLSLPMFSDDEDFHDQITLASNFSFSTSFVAASFGVPVKNSVCFVLVGT